MTRSEYLVFFEKQLSKMLEITRKKNADYSKSHDPFANFRQISLLVDKPNIVEIGFLTRMSDKMSRIGSFVERGELLVKEESVEDTLLDLANYCILFKGYLESEKQKALNDGEQWHEAKTPDGI